MHALLYYTVAMIDKVQFHGHRKGVKEVTVHITGISRQTPGLDLRYTGTSCCNFQRNRLRPT